MSKGRYFASALYPGFSFSGKQPSYTKGDFSKQYGFSIGVGLDSLKFAGLRITISARVIHYGTDVSIYEGAGYVYTAEGKLNKTQLALTVFPIHIPIKKVLLQVGPEFGFLLFDRVNVDGVYRDRGVSDPSFSFSNSSGYLGLRTELAYSIDLDNIILRPKYFFYYGFFSDFLKDGEPIRSIRNGIGVSVLLKKKQS